MRWKKFSIIASLAILLTALLIGRGIIIPNEPSKKTYPIRGIDVSHHNGYIDWKRVAEHGITFAFIKATEGSDWIDSRFSENWKNANEHGITTGAYHYFSTMSPGSTQADNHINTVPKVPGMLPPVIDIEFSRDRSQMTDDEFHRNFNILRARLEEHYGVKPIIYTTRTFHFDYLKGQPVEPLWTRSVFWKPYDLAKSWTFWQYSCLGRVPGIEGAVDLNVFRSTHSEFSQLSESVFKN